MASALGIQSATASLSDTSHQSTPQLAECLCELGRSLDEDGYHHRALPFLLESVALLQQQPDPTDRTWAQIFEKTAGNVAHIYKTLGRLEEAEDVAEQCL